MKYLKNINLKINKYKLFENISMLYSDLNIDENDIDEYFDKNYEVDLDIYGKDFLRNYIDEDSLDKEMKRSFLESSEVENFSDLREYIEKYESNFINEVKEKVKKDYEDDYEDDMTFDEMLDLLDDSDFAELILNDDEEAFLEEKWEEYYDGSGMEYFKNIYGNEIPMSVLQYYIDEKTAKDAIKESESMDYKKEYFIDIALTSRNQDKYLKKVVDYDNDNVLILFDYFDDDADYFYTYEYQKILLRKKLENETDINIDKLNEKELKEFEKEYEYELEDILENIENKYNLVIEITEKFPKIYRKLNIKRNAKKFNL